MSAELLFWRRVVLSANEFAELVAWRVPTPVKGSSHGYKYRFAFIVDGRCVMRYDNEVGKGDHRHYGETEQPYSFIDIDQLLVDFSADIERWRNENRSA